MHKINKKPIRWMVAKSKKQRLNIILLIVANVIFSLLAVAFAFAVKIIIEGAESSDKNAMIRGAIFLIALLVLQFVFRIIVNGLTEYVRGKLEMTYKSYIFSQILEKKYEKINAYHSGELLNRLSSDVGVVAEGVATIIPSAVAAVVRLISAVISLIYIDSLFAGVFVVCGVLVFITIVLMRNKLKNLHKKSQETDGKVRSFMQESVENVLAVKVFSVDDKINEKAKTLQEENFKVKMRRRNYSVTGHAVYNFIFSAGYLFALIYGAVKIFHGTLTHGALSAILQLVNNVQVPFASLSSVVPKYFAMIASAERLIEIEELEKEEVGESIDVDATYEKLDSIQGKDIYFSYGRTAVFSSADFSIKKGEFVVITGRSGGGKSTLVKMLLGVYGTQSGELCFECNDGERITSCVATRKLFSYVPQGNMLFSGTLKENVTLVNDSATEEEIWQALKISCADDFVRELPMKLDTVVGENGLGLSEGQIQRIAIARAILTKAHIIILDEATSALDSTTEEQVLEGLKTIGDVTVIMISHKKAAYAVCDKEIIVKNGKLYEREIKKELKI